MVIETTKIGSLWNHGTTAAGRGRQSPQVHHLFLSSYLRGLHKVISSVQHRAWLKRTCLWLSSVWLQHCLSVGRSSQKEETQLVRLDQDPHKHSFSWPQVEVIWPKGPSVHQATGLCLNCTTMQQCMEKLLCRGQREEARKKTSVVWGIFLQKLMLTVF